MRIKMKQHFSRHKINKEIWVCNMCNYEDKASKFVRCGCCPKCKDKGKMVYDSNKIHTFSKKQLIELKRICFLGMNCLLINNHIKLCKKYYLLLSKF